MISSLKKQIFAAAMAVSMLASSTAQATLATFRWWHTEMPGSCERAQLASEGLGLFSVNRTPIPTYTIPGSFVSSLDGTTGMQAQASFHSVLLRPGSNEMGFEVTIVTGDNSCVYAHEYVQLESPALAQPKPLFDVWRIGTAFNGTTNLELTLQEVNPQLAKDLTNLEAAISANRKDLVANASKLQDLAARQSALQSLETELTDLLHRPLEEIAQVDLDEILDRYADLVDAGVKTALEQVLSDLKQSAEDLRNELTRLLNEFAAQADAAANVVTQVARESGWNPDDPSNYELGAGDVPSVSIPDISPASNAFDPGNDPYAAYADSVLAKLAASVVDNQVSNRGDFLVNVRAWRSNMATLQKALQQRTGVSQTETSAFLKAQNRVTAYVRRFMDASDWYSDALASPILRSLVDGPLRQQWNDMADRIKTDLNLWPPNEPSPFNKMVADTMTGLIGGVQAVAHVGGMTSDYLVVMGQIELVAAKVVIGVTPVVGEALAFCELMTGKDFCIPGGRDLSETERLFSGVGAISMGGVFFRGAKDVTSEGRAAYYLAEAAELSETLVVRGVRTQYVKSWRGLRGGISPVDKLEPFEMKVGKAMIDNGRKLLSIGDPAVRKTLGQPDTVRMADFLAINPGGEVYDCRGQGSYDGRDRDRPLAHAAYERLYKHGCKKPRR